MELALAPYDDFLLDTWDRAEIYRFFRPYQDPFFQVTAPLRITGAKKRCTERKDSFFLYYLFHSLKVVQQETAFCLRFDPDHSDRLRRYKFVHAGCTIAQEDGTFRFGVFPFHEDEAAFMEAGKEQLAKPAGQGLSPNDARSDMVFYSVLPWLSFTGFKNAHHHIEMDHFPRMVTGKPYQQGKDWYMPLSIEVHHALADGRHVAAVFNGLQEILGTY